MKTRIRNLLIAASAIVTQAASSQSFVNGSLTGPTNAFSLIPPGWTTLFPGDPNSTPDTAGASGPHELYTLSPDGGTFVAGAHSTALAIEGVQQTLTGLAPGQEYRLDFYQSNLGFGPNNVGGTWSAVANWQLYLDGQTTGLFSDAMAPQTGPLPNNSWFASSITFTASLGTHAIGFGPHSISGPNAFLAIDGIGLTPIPEPSAAFLLAVGAGAAALLRRRQKKRGRGCGLTAFAAARI